jgi:hypothetical protein
MSTFRTASARVQSLSAEDRKTLARFKKRFGPEDRDGFLTGIEQLDALRATYCSELETIFPADQREAIREAVKKPAAIDAQSDPSLRHRSLAEATRRGIDLEGLKTVQNRLHFAFDQLLNRRNSFSSSDVTARALDARLNWAPMLPDNPDLGTVYVPPFGEPWERSEVSNASGDGRVTENRSYLDAEWGRVGSRLVAYNQDASDSDQIMIYRQNGFIVPFKMPATAIVHVSADFVCLLCRHQIATADEWGWSDFHAFTRTTVLLSVFWERDDGKPTSEVASQPLVPGLDSRGDGESYPGTVVQVDPGERRSLNLFTNAAFPGGKTVWVYIGIADYVQAQLNDVSIDISLDSAWQLSSLAVSSP